MNADAIEGLGGVVEGGAIARAVEPGHGAAPNPRDGRAGAGHFHETACLNCGADLAGAYCAQCGQHAHLHRTMGAFLHDLVHGVLHLDGKTWQTVRMLALWPGKLTRDYIDGQRARYVSPMALFLFAIFAMFAVFSISGASQGALIGESAAVNLEQASAQTQRQRDAAQAELDAMAADDPDRAETEARIATLDRDLATIKTIQVGKVEDFAVEAEESAIGPLVHKWRENPRLMLYKMQSTGYKFSWLLIPLSLPFVWLLFAWKRRFGLYDHAVFVTYSISFMSLLFIAASLLSFAGVAGDAPILIACLVAPLHLYRHVKGGYELGRAGALWRTAALLIFALVVVILFLLILLALGAMG
ncbi:DUF3667 domain-containing protein [Croceicoccus sp. BE223]|uniref:DUF3667 domain-containing protein n=1 Tax=Croceicoccus sp. BE223 TaxID=2817716 RepID=UPI00286538EB|nr:DUF3667 domain-containing protein [Croceicoccus sp. BE223]MDR7101993.1 hypothetical protein [Croceicoccus sp. BE223]